MIFDRRSKNYPSFDQKVSDEFEKMLQKGWIHAPPFSYNNTKSNQNDVRIPNRTLNEFTAIVLRDSGEQP